MYKIVSRVVVLLFSLFVVACATVPSDTIRQAPEHDITLQEVQANPELFQESLVRWGGRIVKVEEVVRHGEEGKFGEESGEDQESNYLRLEILEFPLNESGEPLATESSAGRFVAYIYPPYKSSSYYRNRYLTLVGQINGSEERELDNGETQSLVLIEVQEKYTWQQQHDHHGWSRFFYRIGISNDGFGFGVIFH